MEGRGREFSQMREAASRANQKIARGGKGATTVIFPPEMIEEEMGNWAKEPAVLGGGLPPPTSEELRLWAASSLAADVGQAKDSSAARKRGTRARRAGGEVGTA